MTDQERIFVAGDELAAMLPAELRDSLYRPKPRRPTLGRLRSRAPAGVTSSLS